MMTHRQTLLRTTAALALVAMAVVALPAHAMLERVGPDNPAPSVGNFPAWYQDTTGLTLEFCDPKNQAEVDGGWCLLLPGDVNVPEVFPTNFFDEHFYFDANTTLSIASGGKALLVLATEAAFAIGPAAIGDQITFSRIRVKLTDVPVTGTYRFIHPYGEEVVDAIAGQVRGIFVTDDIGVGTPGGPFDGALHSRLGPFLVASATPGGAELPGVSPTNPTPDTDPAHFGGVFAPTPYPGTGATYLADPARIGPVTGSPLPPFVDSTGALRDHNVFRIEGPPGSGLGVDPLTGASVDWVETTDFSLMGRVFTSTLPGRVNVTRASYTAGATVQKLDVFANGTETTQGRVPAQPRPPSVKPVLSYFEAPCASSLDANGFPVPPYSAPAGATEIPMTSSGLVHWGQSQPATIPAQVCVKDSAARDAAGNIVPAFIPKSVADEVAVTAAFFDPTTRSLHVSATSSDTLTAPTLTLGGFGDLSGGSITVSPITAPPAKVTVLSGQGGSTDLLVTTGTGTPVGIPIATNDALTIAEDSGPVVIAILGNDANVAGGTVTLSSTPRLGTAVLNPDGTVTYTPNANVNGGDSFTYTVTVGTTVSNIGNVSITITPVNDAPVAVNDLSTTSVGVARAINVLANDLDPDGAADLAAAVNVTQPTPAGASVTVAGGVVTFSATAAGTYSLTYQAQDSAGVVSANVATVTVTVTAAEQMAFSAAPQYIRSASRLRVTGTINPAAGQTIRLDIVNAAGTVLATVPSVVEVGGAWAFDLRPLALPNGASAVKATSSNNTVITAALTFK
jgi:VCBS repeat-containing protein